MTASKSFASQADLEEKKVSFTQAVRTRLRLHRRGRPEHRHHHRRRRGAGRRHPGHAGDGAGRDPPHPRGHRQADQVRGADATTTRCACSARRPTSPQHIIASQDTYDLIVERGEQDKASEIGRFPRLFRNVEIVPPGMTWPTITFTGKMTLWLGKLEVQLLQLGRGHTKGDTVVWLPSRRSRAAQRRPGRVRRHAVCRRRLLQGLAADARERRRAEAAGAGAGPRRGADRRRSRWPPA